LCDVLNLEELPEVKTEESRPESETLLCTVDECEGQPSKGKNNVIKYILLFFHITCRFWFKNNFNDNNCMPLLAEMNEFII